MLKIIKYFRYLYWIGFSWHLS